MKRLRWIALAALAVVPYLGAIRSPLLYDDRTMLDNPWLVRQARPVSVFQHDYWYGTKHESSELYRPLTVLSLAWNARATPSREGLRAVNLAAHASATLALAWFLGAIVSRRAAWLGAALFAVHPLGSEAVLWVVGRAELFSAALGLLAFGLFMRLDDRRGLGGWPFAASVAAFLGALCFKESAAAWLVIGAAWIWIRPTGQVTPATVVAARAAGYLGALLVFVALRGAVVGWGRHAASFVDNPLVTADTATRAVNAILLGARYVAKMIWPGTLSVEYGFDQIPVVPPLPWGGIGAATTVAVVIASVVALRRRGHGSAAFLTAFVPAAFAVTGNLVFPIGTIFGERLAYLPLAGICGLAGLALAAVPSDRWRAVVMSILLVACATRTFVRGRDYQDVATLTEATVEASPRAVKALVNAGRVRLRQGQAARAVPPLETAVALWPDYARAWELLAEAYAATGDTGRAMDARRRASAAASQAAPGDVPL